MRSWLENNLLIIRFMLFRDFTAQKKHRRHRESLKLCTLGIRTYSTTIAVLLGSPSPALFTAMMRYSSSLPRGCSTSVASVVTAVAASSQGPAGRSRRITLHALTVPPSEGFFQSKNTQPLPCFGASSNLAWPGGDKRVLVFLPAQPMSFNLSSSKFTVFSE